MALRLVQVNYKAAEDEALGRFWAGVLGWVVSSEGPGVTNVEPAGLPWPHPGILYLDVVRVADPAAVRHRAHVELATASPAHHAELVARVQALGATPVAVSDGSPTAAFADPEGNVFCVLEPRGTYADTGQVAAAVVACADPRAMARFWGETLDWTVPEVADDRALLRPREGVGPRLELVRQPHVDDRRNRVHLDLLPHPGADQAAEVARLEALGGTPADVGQGDAAWRVLADPEGQVFCVLRAPA